MIQETGIAEIALSIGITIIVVLIAFWIGQTIMNSRQPLRNISVKVVAKRTEVSGGMNNMPGLWSATPRTTTSYYVTFEHEDGVREEFRVSGREYGMIAEGDWGTIGRQGTWFKGFKRSRAAAR